MCYINLCYNFFIPYSNYWSGFEEVKPVPLPNYWSGFEEVKPVTLPNYWSGFEAVKPAPLPNQRLQRRCRFLDPYDEIANQVCCCFLQKWNRCLFCSLQEWVLKICRAHIWNFQYLTLLMSLTSQVALENELYMWGLKGLGLKAYWRDWAWRLIEGIGLFFVRTQ